MSIVAILNALAAIPSFVGFIESAASQITLWFVQRQNNKTLAAISDAAALAARAQTDADRYAAAKAWQTALSKSRITAN